MSDCSKPGGIEADVRRDASQRENEVARGRVRLRVLHSTRSTSYTRRGICRSSPPTKRRSSSREVLQARTNACGANVATMSGMARAPCNRSCGIARVRRSSHGLAEMPSSMHPLPMRALLAALLTSELAVACGRAENHGEMRLGSASAPRTAVKDVGSAGGGSAELVGSSSTTVPASATVRTPTALGGEPLIALEVTGFQPAVVSVPVSTQRPRPIVLALHGNYDRPEWQCGVWNQVVRERAFVLCPRGIPRRGAPAAADRWEYASARAMKSEIEPAVAALRTRFAEFVADGPLLFIGFSLGAGYGAPLVQAAPELYSRVVFIEGGASAWNVAAAKRFAKTGGKKLILACGQAGCLAQVKQLGPALTRAGLDTRVGGSANAGHTYDGPVAQVVSDNWDWLTGDDPRFAP
jgi:predicted esterase